MVLGAVRCYFFCKSTLESILPFVNVNFKTTALLITKNTSELSIYYSSKITNFTHKFDDFISLN